MNRLPLITTLATLLSLFSMSLLNAQGNFEKDSISLETDYDTVYENYKTAQATKEDWNQLLKHADSLEHIYPEEMYFSYKKAVILNRIALTNIYAGDFPEALDQLARAIQIKKDTDTYDEASRDYYLMGIIWTRMQEYSKSKKCFDSAYAINQRNLHKGTSELKHKATLLNMYGCHYANVDSLDVAEVYFKKAIKFADSLDFKDRVAMNSIQYAEVIFDQKRYAEALKLRQRAVEIYTETNDTLAKYGAISALAESYFELGNYKEAIDLMEKTVAFHKSRNQNDALLLNMNLYINALDKGGRVKDALNAQRELQVLVDSLRNASEYKKLADVEANFKYKVKKSLDSLRIVKDRQLIEAENIQKSKTRFWIIIASLLLVLSIVAFTYFRNRQKVKEQAYQNILLNNKVATKTEEINELLTETIQHIKSKERIAENLQKLSSQREGVTLKSIIADLKASKADHAKLILIKQNIEQVNFEFTKRLKSLHPNLTKTDIEICSFIRIGLSRKEVANLRNTSLEAVKSTRFRLKKKLQLASEASLDEYINSL